MNKAIINVKSISSLLLIALLIVFISEKLFLMILFAAVFILAIKVMNKNAFVFLIIIALLTLTSTINPSIRLGIQLSSIIILFYFFLKTFGLEFQKYPKIPKELSLLITSIILSMLIAALFSKYTYLSGQQIIRLAMFLIIIYLIFSTISNNKDLRNLLFTLIVIGLIYSYFIFQELANNNFNFIELNLSHLEKLSGSFINMNSFGSFYVIIISLLASFIIGKNEKAVRWSLLFIVLIFLTGLFIANSRAAILALFISSLFITYNLNKKLFKGILILSLASPLLLLIENVREFSDVYFRLEKISTGRDVIFDSIFNVIKNNPILGVGPGASKQEIYSNLSIMLGSPAENLLSFHYNQIEFGHAHNFYLFFWSDLGLFGLFTSLLLPFVYFNLCHKAIKKTKSLNSDYYLISIGITAAGLGLFIRGFFEWGNLISYGTLNLDLPFWLLLCFLVYIINSDTAKNGKIFSRQ
jgi:O-antigen ligase